MYCILFLEHLYDSLQGPPISNFWVHPPLLLQTLASRYTRHSFVTVSPLLYKSHEPSSPYGLSSVQQCRWIPSTETVIDNRLSTDRCTFPTSVLPAFFFHIIPGFSVVQTAAPATHCPRLGMDLHTCQLCSLQHSSLDFFIQSQYKSDCFRYPIKLRCYRKTETE